MGSDAAMRPLLLLPEMMLLAGGLVALLGGSFLPRARQWVTRVVAAAALVAAGVAAAIGLAGPATSAFEGTFSVDTATGVARLLATVGTLIVLALASDEIAASARESETYALLLFSTTGALVMAGADDLLVVTVGFLLTSIPLYGLIGIARTSGGAEAAMKTYLLGALFGILLLLGVTILYGVAGTTMYAAPGWRVRRPVRWPPARSPCWSA
jgi:NADH-quinone oxidoreductase subunit N